jgi:Tol biopolymer transport system component
MLRRYRRYRASGPRRRGGARARTRSEGYIPPGKLSLWSVSIFGGSPRLLADDGRAGSLSPDGSHIAFQRYDFGREEWVMRADGTEQVTKSLLTSHLG